MPITINIPFLVKVNDYHEFSTIQQCYKHVGLNLKYKECGFKDALYIAVFYIELTEETELLIDLMKKRYDKQF